MNRYVTVFVVGIAMMLCGIFGLLLSLYPRMREDILMDDVVSLAPGEVMTRELRTLMTDKGIAEYVELEIMVNLTGGPILLMVLSQEEYELFIQSGDVDTANRWNLTTSWRMTLSSSHVKADYLVIRNDAGAQTELELVVSVRWMERAYLNLTIPFIFVLLTGLALCLVSYRGLLIFLIFRGTSTTT